jgi:hypothetical protein
MVERGLIAQYGTMHPNGYNMTNGGEMRANFRQSPATIKKMQAAAAGRVIAESTKIKVSKAVKAYWSDPEKRKIAMASRNTEAFKTSIAKTGALLQQNFPAAFKGHIHSEESKKKMSEAHKGRPAWNKGIPMSPERIAQMTAVHIGRKASEETKIKMALAQKARRDAEHKKRAA